MLVIRHCFCSLSLKTNYLPPSWNAGVEKRDVNKRLTSRASETGDIKSLNAGAGINGINDGRAPKGKDALERSLYAHLTFWKI